MDVTDQPRSSGTYRGFLAARAGMPEWLPHLLVMVAGMAIVLFVGLNLFRALRGLIILLVISLFLATALEPAVNFLARHGWRRGPATGATFLAGSAFGVGSRLLTTFFQGLTIALFTFYLVADAPRFRRVLMSTMPAEQQREVLRVWEIAIDKTGGYFYSRALLAAIAAVSSWIAFRILGVPFAAALALWLGVLSQFLPVIGTYVGGALPALIALLESPGKAVGVLVFIVVYQQIENYLLSPRITARTMSLHPAVSFGSAIAGATLLGAPGAIMALPVAATVQAFISTYLHRHEVVESTLIGGAPGKSDEQEPGSEPKID